MIAKVFSLVTLFGIALASLEPMKAPQPYKFGYNIKDKHGDQYREEEGNGAGGVKGSYGFTDDRGVKRRVEYVADKAGFRAQVKTNEPGTANQNPAAVQMISEAPYAGGVALGLGARGGMGYGGNLEMGNYRSLGAERYNLGVENMGGLEGYDLGIGGLGRLGSNMDLDIDNFGGLETEGYGVGMGGMGGYGLGIGNLGGLGGYGLGGRSLGGLGGYGLGIGSLGGLGGNDLGGGRYGLGARRFRGGLGRRGVGIGGLEGLGYSRYGY